MIEDSKHNLDNCNNNQDENCVMIHSIITLMTTKEQSHTLINILIDCLNYQISLSPNHHDAYFSWQSTEHNYE